jgi:hypothetical protein
LLGNADSTGDDQMGLELLQRALGDPQELLVVSRAVSTVALGNVGGN